jgi:hypothetical protein
MSYINHNYLEKIAFGEIAGVTPWSKLGFNASLTTTEEDIWSAGGLYAFPTAATAMEVVSSSATDNDSGGGATPLHSGGATGVGGSTTTISVAGENFLTTTAVGDLVILDKAGTTPEWGYVTAVTSDTVLTCSGGFSSGGTGASRSTYHVVDVSAKTGVHAVRIEYLDTSWAAKSEIVILDGDAAMDLVGSPYRINSFRAISVGTNNGAVGNLTLQANGAGTTYSYITLGYTRARNSVYTVPAGKTLYVCSGTVGFATTDKSAEVARVRVKANLVDSTQFIMGGVVGLSNTFWVYAEELVSNGSEPFLFPVYPRIPAKVDIKCSATASGPGAVTTMLRGFLVTN